MDHGSKVSLSYALLASAGAVAGVSMLRLKLTSASAVTYDFSRIGAPVYGPSNL